jgi:hypothetical protein
MARKSKSSGPTYIYNDPIQRVTSRSPMPFAPAMPPSKPPGARVKDDTLPRAPVRKDDPDAPITSNPYEPDDSVLQGGASAAPEPGDTWKPVNTTEPGPNTGNDRPEIH